MPELPEVETIRKIIEPQVKGKSLISVEVRNPQVIAYPSSEGFIEAACNNTIIGMNRRGKYLNLRLPSAEPTAIGNMSRTELDVELMKGVESLQSDKTYTADEVDAELARDYGI